MARLLRSTPTQRRSCSELANSLVLWRTIFTSICPTSARMYRMPTSIHARLSHKIAFVHSQVAVSWAVTPPMGAPYYTFDYLFDGKKPDLVGGDAERWMRYMRQKRDTSAASQRLMSRRLETTQ